MNKDKRMQVENIQVDSNIVPDLDNINQGQLSFFEQVYNPDVLDCLSSLSNDEVFTSPRLANQMLDLLPDSIWQNKNAKFLDPVCKSGVFLREIVKRLDKGLQKQIPNKQIRINHILTKQVFGIAITQLTALLSRRSVYCTKTANSPLSICDEFDNEMGNIIFGNANHIFENGKCRECGASYDVFGNRKGLENHAYAFIHSDRDIIFDELLKMQFDVIIGNPPYQLSDGGGVGSSAIPLYHKFVEQAKKLNPNYLIMITPSRWFTGGKGLDEFRDNMINDKRIAQIHDFPNSKDCFDNVEIKGGVSYFLWDKNYNDGCEFFTYENSECVSQLKRPLKENGINILVRYNKAISILRKVSGKKEKSFGDLVSSRNPFRLASRFIGNKLPYKNRNDNVKLYSLNNTSYIKLEDIYHNKNLILRHKILVPKAFGTGESQTDLIKPIYAGINSACTETYLVVGTFESEDVCNNVMSYMSTKFFHFMVTLVKNTQNTTKATYALVPMQDFSRAWTDEQLYVKYGLSKDEINFIENMIRPMENDSNQSKKSRTKKSQQENIEFGE